MKSIDSVQAINLKKNKAEEKVELTPTQKILKIGKVLEQQISPQLQKDGGDIDAITAATISSRAYIEAVKSAVALYNNVITK